MINRVVHITEKLSGKRSRSLYDILERIDSFTLFDCKDRLFLNVDGGINKTLVLDNIDLAADINAIFKYVFNHLRNVKTLVIVDSNGAEVSVEGGMGIRYERWDISNTSNLHNACSAILDDIDASTGNCDLIASKSLQGESPCMMK